MKIDGRCHCNKIRFEAEVDPTALSPLYRLPDADRLGIQGYHRGSNESEVGVSPVTLRKTFPGRVWRQRTTVLSG